MNYVSIIGMNYVNIIGFSVFNGFMIQFISGILLCIFFNSCFILCYDSVMYIMMEVLCGYLISGFHCLFAVIYMFCVYFHVFRGFWLSLLDLDYVYMVWISGIFLFVMCMLEGFIGYVLMWGQLSYWGYMVVLGLCSIMGMLEWLMLELLWCSGYVVVYRIFLLHFMIGWLLGVFILFHILILHGIGSINPMVSSLSCFIISFFLVIYNDLIFSWFIWLVLVVIWYMEPDYWGNSDNFEVANVLSTPEHIIPEVYFDYLFYLLRSICIKFLGMCCIVGWMMICMV